MSSLVNDLAAIEAGIVTVLNTVSGLEAVFGYEPVDIEALPAASVFYAGFESEDAEIPNTQETRELFVIRIYVRFEDPEFSQAEMKTLVPLVRQAFRDDRDLGGACWYTNLSEGEISFIPKQSNPWLVATLLLTVVAEESE